MTIQAPPPSPCSSPHFYELEERKIKYRKLGRLSGSAQPATVNDINEIFSRMPLNCIWVSLRPEEVFYVNGRSISVPPNTPPPDCKGIPITKKKFVFPAAPRGSLEDEDPQSRPVTPEDLNGELAKRFVPIKPRFKEGRSDSLYILECTDGSLSEEAIVAQKKGEFMRIPIEDKRLPSHEKLDEIIQLFDRYVATPGLHIHFHCAGGKGRTSTVLALFHLLQRPYLSIQELFSQLDSWGNKIQTEKPKDRNDPTFWYAFGVFAKQRHTGDLWTDFLANLVENSLNE